MKLVLGEVLCIFGLIYHHVILLGAVNPDKPWWAKPILNDTFHLFIIICCTAFGPTYMVIGAAHIASPGGLVINLVISAVLLTGTIMAVKKMRVSQRVEEFRAMAGRQKSEDPSSART